MSTDLPSPKPDIPSNDDEEEDLPSLLLQRIWQGKLPTKISLAANESKSFTNSPPLYVPLLSPPLRRKG